MNAITPIASLYDPTQPPAWVVAINNRTDKCRRHEVRHRRMAQVAWSIAQCERDRYVAMSTMLRADAWGYLAIGNAEMAWELHRDAVHYAQQARECVR